MIPVKICGITRLEDARAAVGCGAQALGFVFAPSPRRVSVAMVREITGRISPLVTKVGVFVNEDPQIIKEVMRDCHLDLAQLHGEETPEICAMLEGRVIKAFKAGKDIPDLTWKQAGLRGILIDTYLPGASGGTGEPFDWQLVDTYRVLELPLILAGGLHAGNVSAAIWSARPDGIDVSSGVELQPGIKDPVKIGEFMEALREL
ncbi:MAG TPA: phosphoribosylanthranilate isomerase [Bacillota bacterium]|nr:phosphoribosylanthranilate isomerase [Bacillota bacterium]